MSESNEPLDGEVVNLTPIEPVDPPEVARGKQLARGLTDLEFEHLVRARIRTELQSYAQFENLSASATYAELKVYAEDTGDSGWTVMLYQPCAKYSFTKGEILSNTVRSGYRVIRDQIVNKLSTLLPRYGG